MEGALCLRVSVYQGMYLTGARPLSKPYPAGYLPADGLEERSDDDGGISDWRGWTEVKDWEM